MDASLRMSRPAAATWAVALATLLALTAGAALAATVGTLPGTFTVVDDGPGNQTDPHIDQSLVAYTSQSGTHSEIRYRDLVSGAAGAVPGAGQDLLPDVFDGTIAFTRFVPGGAGIFSYDTVSGALTELDPPDEGPSRRRNPAIAGDVVAWEDFTGEESPASSDIVVYDRTTHATTRLSDDALFDLAPAVSPDGAVIVWLKCTSSAQVGCSVWKAQRTAGGWSTTEVASQGESSSPDTDGAVIVYASTRDGDTDLYWVPAHGGPETRVALPGAQRNPSVSDGLVSFESLEEPATTYDVFVYDLAGAMRYQVTDTPTISEMLNDISVGADGKARVVWSVGIAGDLNVHAFTFDPPGAVAYEAVFHPPVQPPPAVTTARAGQVLPVKVEVSRDGVADDTGPVAIELWPLDACADGTPAGDAVPAASAGRANSGNLLRWEADEGVWAYNLDTSGLAGDACYRVEIWVGGSVDPATARASGGALAGSFVLHLRG